MSHRLLRHYEEQGLLTAERTAGGHRVYDPSAVETVRRIRVLLDAGLPIRVIREVAPCFDDAGSRIGLCVADLLRAHATRLQERMSEIAAQRSLALMLLPETVVSA